MAAPSPPPPRPAMAMADNDGRRTAPFIAPHHASYAYGGPIPEQTRSPPTHSPLSSWDSVISHPFSPKISSPPSPIASITFPPRAQLDLEKQNVFPTHASLSGPEEVPDMDALSLEMDVLRILVYLSAPCAIFSIVVMIWTILALLFTCVLQPLRVCSYRPTFNEQLSNFLAPPLNEQLRLIHSSAQPNRYNASMLVVVQLFAPFVAIFVTVASWNAGFFWLFSAILGDPAGQDGHNDGHTTVLNVRNWWEWWLVRACRDQRGDTTYLD